MAFKSVEDEGGLGILASASAFVASNHQKILEGEPSTQSSSERGDDSENGDENCSQNAADYKPAVAQIGVDLSAMEYAMAEYLLRKKDNVESSITQYCRLCDASSNSYDELMEHLITDHRMALLQSMHDLNLAGMLQQYAAYISPTQDSPSLFSAVIDSIREIACTTPTASSGLEPYIKKILDDGPTAWIMEHAIQQRVAQAKTIKPEPLVYPICPITSRIGPGYSIKTKVEMPIASKAHRGAQPLTSNTSWSRNR